MNVADLESWMILGSPDKLGCFGMVPPIKKLTQSLSFLFQSPFCLLKHGLNHLKAPCFTKDPNMGMGQVTYDYHILGGITFKNHQSQLWLWAPGPQTNICLRLIHWGAEEPEFWAEMVKSTFKWIGLWYIYIYMRKGIWNKLGIYNESIVCVCTYILYNLIPTFDGIELGIYWKYHWNITGIIGFNTLMGIWNALGIHDGINYCIYIYIIRVIYGSHIDRIAVSKKNGHL